MQTIKFFMEKKLRKYEFKKNYRRSTRLLKRKRLMVPEQYRKKINV